MGGGNGQKAGMAREKNLEKQKAVKGSQLDSNKKAMSIQPVSCKETLLAYDIIKEIRKKKKDDEYHMNRKSCEYVQEGLNFVDCKVCMQTFMCTTTEVKCKEHAEAKHPKSDLHACFPHLKK